MGIDPDVVVVLDSLNEKLDIFSETVQSLRSQVEQLTLKVDALTAPEEPDSENPTDGESDEGSLGDGSDLTLTNVSYNPPRVISGGTLGRVSLTNVDGLHLMNVATGEIVGKYCKNITISGCDVDGTVDFRSDGELLRIVDNKVSNGTNGIVVFGCRDLVVNGNQMNNIKSDSMKFGDCQDFLISENIGSIIINRGEDTHPDFCQIQGPLTNGEIAYNVHCPAGTASSQGIFGGQDSVVLVNVHIHDNFLYGHHIRQLDLTSADSATVIENNTVLSPVLTSLKGLSKISVDGATIRNNIHSERENRQGVFSGGIAIQVTDPTSDWYGPDLIKGLLNADGTQPDQLEWWSLEIDSSLEGFGADLSKLPRI